MSNYTIQDADVSSLDKNIKIAVITAEFNKNYTEELQNININYLKSQGFENIDVYEVPGALEIPGVAHKILENDTADLILTFGVVIRGETTHYDIVAGETARGIMDLNITYTTPLILGVLTCENTKQVEERIKPVYAISGLKTLKTHNSI